MNYLISMWTSVKNFFLGLVGKSPEKPVVKSAPVKDGVFFQTLPFEKQIEYARNGVWINMGLGDFFDKRHDTSLSDAKRREIAKAYAFRYGMPYIDPTVSVKTPTGLGMGDDGNQK